MNKAIQTLLIASALLILSSFSNKQTIDFIGTYGVSDNDPSKIELVLNGDQTFSYQDFSNPSAPINIKGNWKRKNNQVILKDYNTELSFHSKWKIAKDGKLIKSRKGMTFYTLAKGEITKIF